MTALPHLPALPKPRNRSKTRTSTFGVSGRQGHDSSAFYRHALEVAELDDDDEVVLAPADVVNRFYCHSSEAMVELPDKSVGLCVTSPPYHGSKDYDTGTAAEFLALMERVFTETYRVLEPGGRLAVNVAGLGRRPYVHLQQLVVQICKDIGFLSRGEIVWTKGKGASGSIAVGSYMSPANPVLRDLHEYVEVFSRGSFGRAQHWKKRRDAGLPWESTITKEDFLQSTLSVWNIPPESAKRVGHPAPFPVELPRRLIELYTYKNDLVLDPFAGAGTTAVAAHRTGRRWVGYDTDDTYLDLGRKRIAAEGSA